MANPARVAGKKKGSTRPSRNALRKMSVAMGVPQVSGNALHTATDKVLEFADALVEKAALYSEVAGRKTMTTADLERACDLLGRRIYTPRE